MIWVILKIFILLVLLLLGAAKTQDTPLQSATEDSVSTTPEKQDSTRLYRPAPPKKLKSYNIHMTEYMVKANLARLSQYAEGRYLNPMFSLDELFIQANDFPEEVKNKMFGYTIAGGVVREVFKNTRKFLNKNKIRFIYPNLYGLNITHPVPGVNARLHFRAMSMQDRYYMLNLDQGRVYLYYRETPIVYQRGVNYKLHKSWRIFVQRAEYRDTAYNGFGLSHSTKKFFFYLMHSQNVNLPQYSRTYLYVNIHFDK